MSADVPPPPSDPVLGDDRLLDALARGEQPPPDHPAGDPLTALLADWRTELVARSERVESALEQKLPREGTGGAPAPPPARPAPVLRRRAATTVGPATPGRPWARRRTTLTGAALSLFTAVGGLWLGAARAEPGGLLWPVTELVNADRAQSLRTEHEVGRTLDQARRDLADHRYADARSHLERAVALLGTLDDDDTATRLRADIDELRRLLPLAPTGPSTPGVDASTGAVPMPPVPDPAMSTAEDPASAEPASPPTPARPTSTAPATADRRPTPNGGAQAGRPSTPAADLPRQPPPAPTRTAVKQVEIPERDGAAARSPAPGLRSAGPEHGVAGRTEPRRAVPDGVGPDQAATADPTGPDPGSDDGAADTPVGPAYGEVSTVRPDLR